MTSRYMNSGEDGSTCISLAARITCAELDTGNSSAAPWMRARMRICQVVTSASLARV